MPRFHTNIVYKLPFIRATRLIAGLYSVRSMAMFVALAVMSWFPLMGQTARFSPDPDVFVKEIGELLRTCGSSDCNLTAVRFEANYADGRFTKNDIGVMSNVCNILDQRKFRVYPHYENYFRSANLLLDFGVSKDLFKEWNEVVYAMIKGADAEDKTSWIRMMDFCILYFTEGVFYNSGNRTWKGSHKEFRTRYADGAAYFDFGTLDLTATTKYNTSMIHATAGRLYPHDMTWRGRGGKFTWAEVQLNEDEVYCTLNAYAIDFKQSSFVIDSVLFYYKPLAANQILGQLTNKLLSNKRPDQAKFPAFVSYRNDILVPELMPYVNYKGAIALEGRDILGRGSKKSKASLEFYDKNWKLLCRARSQIFQIELGKRMAASRAELSIMLGKDSIHNLALQLNYDILNRQLIGSTVQSGYATTRFLSSYHMLEMAFERVIWNLDQPKARFNMVAGGGQKTAYLESINLFEQRFFLQYQGVLSYNPIQALKNACEAQKTRVLTSASVARAFNKDLTVEGIRRILFTLMEDGFIIYDQEDELVYVLDKVYRYVYSNAKTIDFDAVNIASQTDKDNATLNLETYALTIDGAYTVPLSKSQYVYLFPKDKKIAIDDNRNMNFDGTVFAGRLDIYGHEFAFEYDSFDIDLAVIDSVSVNVPTDNKDHFGELELLQLNSVIENLRGHLTVDAPGNKSGVIDSPEFSRFVNETNAYIYYDRKCIFRGAYPRDTFSIELQPFTWKNLDEFNLKAQDFPGTLRSPIFPDLVEQIKIQKDLSLGFKHAVPKNGYPVYGGKGQYWDSLYLSNQGLRGKGRLRYLSTDAVSSDFRFFPDSAWGIIDSLAMQKMVLGGVEFPGVTSKNAILTWIPSEDRMRLKMVEEPFKLLVLFDGYATFAGELIVTPEGLFGNGTVDWAEATLHSDSIAFGSFGFKADDAQIQIKSEQEGQIAFQLDHVFADIDFGTQKGIFRSHNPDEASILDVSQFKTNMNQFDWDIERQVIHFQPREGAERAVFTSIKPEQEGLEFAAAAGSYSLKTELLSAQGVQLIRVADAFVKPYDGKIQIGRNAAIKPIDSATLIVDTSTQRHTFKQARVEIRGKNNYTARGLYTFTSIGNKQVIDFQNIATGKMERGAVTTAEATLLADDNFFIDGRTQFKGKAILGPRQENLLYRGFLKLATGEMKEVKTDWFSVDQEIDPAAVRVILKGNTNEAGQPANCGLFVRNDILEIYATLMAAPNHPDDRLLIEAEGELRYEAGKGYIAEMELKETDEYDAPYGRSMIVDDQTGKIQAQGRTKLGFDFGGLGTDMGCRIVRENNEADFTAEVALGFKFVMTKDLWFMIEEEVSEYALGGRDIDYAADKNLELFSFMIESRKDIYRLYSATNRSGKIAMPDEYRMPVMLGPMTLVWDEAVGTFHNQGPLVLTFIGEYRLGRQMKGFVELGQRRRGDFVNMYFRANKSDSWFFISYEAGILKFLTSYDDFNTLLLETKPKELKYQGEGGELEYQPALLQDVESFVNRMKEYE